MVGRWFKHSVGITLNDKVPSDYKEIVPNFYEEFGVGIKMKLGDYKFWSFDKANKSEGMEK